MQKKSVPNLPPKKGSFLLFCLLFFCSFFCSFFAFLERCYFVFAFHARTFSALFLHFFCFPYSHRSWLTGQHKSSAPCLYSWTRPSIAKPRRELNWNVTKWVPDQLEWVFSFSTSRLWRDVERALLFKRTSQLDPVFQVQPQPNCFNLQWQNWGKRCSCCWAPEQIYFDDWQRARANCSKLMANGRWTKGGNLSIFPLQS